MFLLLWLLTVAAADDTKTTNKTVVLVETLRRQLMQDNYDYLPSEDELMPPVHAPYAEPANDPLYDHDVEAPADKGNDITDNDDRPNDKTKYNDGDNDIRTANGPRGNLDIVRYRIKKDRDDQDERDFIPRAKDNQFDETSKKKERERVKGHVVSKKDLLYYVDDETLRGRSGSGGSNASVDFEDDQEPASSTAKYKIIKVKSLHPSRRSQTIRRLLQEESAAGVAIISLDGRPFPEFHLPRARRQYMLGDSAELPAQRSSSPPEASVER